MSQRNENNGDHAIASTQVSANSSSRAVESPGTALSGNAPTASGRSASPIVNCVGVHKGYKLGDRTVSALRGVDLQVNGPGFFAIMGASGSGKSTLMHLLGALDKPDQGEMHVSGHALHTMSERELTRFRRHEIGIVFQQFNLIPTLTARENVELPGMLAGDRDAKLRARSAELLNALGVGERSGHRPDALSGGEQQRVAIARALLYSPRVLLADEPTGNLDSASSEKLWNLLASLAREQEMTVLMVTHEPAAAVHCEKIFVLRDGRMTGEIQTEGLDAAGVASSYQHLVRAS
ncbi:MAG: ABC transporter ATP-binding protein [Pyrinomonadaceae bacterium]|nr:ABC transporter ATP-binding protein [Phycisphaerales bacterium]